MGTSLSVVIPAFNEADRLPAFLDRARNYLEGAGFDSYEVIVVDDGSRDATARLVQGRSESWDRLRLLGGSENRGKGAAVREGVLAAESDLILFADADGATPISEERLLREAIEAGADLAVGSRLVGPRSLVDRAPHRDLLGRAFALAVRFVVPIGVRDPQCGFKMFRRVIGKHLFQICSEDGYLFDLQILAEAEKFGYRASEVAVRWREIPGSKVRLVRDTWRMLHGLARVRCSIERIAADARPATQVTVFGLPG